MSATAAAPITGAVPDAVAPPPRHPRFPLLDGMRALAVLCVVGVHAAVSGHGVSGSLTGRLAARLNLGVTIFFLISGFLLYRPMIAHRGGGAPAPRLADYLKRRFLRIYPAYWLVLTVLVVLPGAPRVIFGSWWPMYALVHTLVPGHGVTCVTAGSCGLAQTWSLVVELTFYAVLPLYALAAAWLTRPLTTTAWMAGELLLLALLSAASVVLQWGVLEPLPTWFGATVAAYVLWFALGMGMAIVSVWLDAQPRPPAAIRLLRARPAAAWAAAAAAYLALALWLPGSTFLIARDQVMGAHIGYALIAALLLLPAVFAAPGGRGPARLLAHPVLAWLGVISYGIFLWHGAINLKLAADGVDSFPVLFLAVLAISIPCAAVSYYGLERPALKLKYRRLTARSRTR